MRFFSQNLTEAPVIVAVDLGDGYGSSEPSCNSLNSRLAFVCKRPIIARAETLGSERVPQQQRRETLRRASCGYASSLVCPCSRK